MIRHELTPLSLDRLTVFVALVICVSLSSTAGLGVGSEHGPYGTPAESALSALIAEGPELHASLRANPLDSLRHLGPGMVLPQNPYLSADEKFVAGIAGSSSQGRLHGTGIRAALYALYTSGTSGDVELGIYGLEAESEADADWREQALRGIWSHNARVDRARVYRKGLVLVVVWHDGVSKECWESVMASVAERLDVADKL